MKPETFCDNCADVLNLKDAVIFGACPFPTASTHAGESATLCKACAHPPAPNISPMENQNTPTPSGTSPGAASAGSGQPLHAVPLDVLLRELMRRELAGDCVALVVTPSDLSEYWESDESGATNPASRVPEPEEMRAVRKAFARWQDCGGFTEIMEVCRDAWQEEQARQLDRQEGKGESK